jgi:peptide chain release factor 2
MEDPGIWDNPAEAQKLGKVIVSLEMIVDTIETVCSGGEGVSERLDLAADVNVQA